MSWFSSSQSIPIDDKVAEASSEAIPNGEIDLLKALEISDLIRSKQTAPRDAMRSLKKRFLGNKNPNVQRSVLKLIDFCIKNGGEHFVVEISTKEFLDPVVVLLHNKQWNEDVSALSLELIQNWSLLFSKNPKLSYITTVYDKLTKEGFSFPSIYNAEFNESFLESNVAPEWVDSDACMICSDLFSMINRKHHCRACGGVFCGKHTSKSLPLPEFGITIPVRVCDNCYEQRKPKHKERHHRSNGHKKSASLKSASAPQAEDEDEDLKRAIELSLKESGITTGESTGPTNIPQPIDSGSNAGADDDDEDMKRAIEASLRDMKLNEPSSQEPQAPQEEENPYSNILPQFSATSASIRTEPAYQGAGPQHQAYVQPQQQASAPPNDQFSMTEEENINLFANLIERHKNSGDNNIYQDNQIQTLHSNVMSLRPKLNKNINDINTKYDAFTDMHSKIGTIMRLYDGILQAHMNSIYSDQQQQLPPNQAQAQYPPQQQQYAQPPQQYPQQYTQQPQQYPSAVSTPNYPPSQLQTQSSFETPQYPPQSASQASVPSFPPPETEAFSPVKSPQSSQAQFSTINGQGTPVPVSPVQSFSVPSYPPAAAAVEPVTNANSKSYDFPEVPSYPVFEQSATPEEEQPKVEEKREEAPLIDL